MTTCKFDTGPYFPYTHTLVCTHGPGTCAGHMTFLNVNCVDGCLFLTLSCLRCKPDIAKCEAIVQ